MQPKRESGRTSAGSRDATCAGEMEPAPTALAALGPSSDTAGPSSRPKGRARRAIRSLARQHAEGAVAALVAVMNDRNATPAARVSAASALLNWGYGKGTAGEAGASGQRTTPKVVRLRWSE